MGQDAFARGQCEAKTSLQEQKEVKLLKRKEKGDCCPPKQEAGLGTVLRERK